MTRHVGKSYPAVFIRLALSAFAIFLGGCAVGPNYRRPSVSIPVAYRGLTTEEAVRTEPVSLGDQKWWEVFQDRQLQELIRTALQQNYDVRIAATRILQAEAQLGITRADQLPRIDAGAGSNMQRNPKSKFFPANNTGVNQGNLSLSWELDFWGKYRRSTEAARAGLLASEWGRQAVVGTLVSNVAAAYFQLREHDLELDISKRTLASRQESLQLIQTLEERGINSMIDVRQAEQLVFTAAAEITDLEKRKKRC